MSRDGNWFHYSDRNTIYRAHVEYEPVFRRVGRPETVIEVGQVIRFEFDVQFDFDVHPDGERIFVATGPAGNARDQDWLAAIFNFRDTGLCESLSPSFQAWLATVASLFTSGCTNVANEDADESPAEFALHCNYPNPFNPQTTIRFTLPEAAAVSIQIIDLSGAVVGTITRPIAAAGAHSVAFDGTDLPSGTYISPSGGCVRSDPEDGAVEMRLGWATRV